MVEEVYIVTNTTVLGEYTPSAFKLHRDARRYMLETTVNNIKAGFPDVPEYTKPNDTNDELLDDALKDASYAYWIDHVASPYIKEHYNCDVHTKGASTFVQYQDETENRMTVYAIQINNLASVTTYEVSQR